MLTNAKLTPEQWKDVERGREVVAADGSVNCRHRKVAIVGNGVVGAADGGRDQAPYGDSDWCVWALNEIWQPAFTRHFELHPMRVQDDRDLTVLRQLTVPTYVLEETPLVPRGVRFPLDQLRAQPWHRDYFTCTFAYQIALAINEGFEQIGLWGVGLWAGTARERTTELACVEYWMGLARGRGIVVDPDSDLARQEYLYGYDYDEEKADVEAAVARLRDVISVESASRR